MRGGRSAKLAAVVVAVLTLSPLAIAQETDQGTDLTFDATIWPSKGAVQVVECGVVDRCQSTGPWSPPPPPRKDCYSSDIVAPTCNVYVAQSDDVVPVPVSHNPFLSVIESILGGSRVDPPEARV